MQLTIKTLPFDQEADKRGLQVEAQSGSGERIGDLYVLPSGSWRRIRGSSVSPGCGAWRG